LERNPQEYVEKLIAVFREVRRVLRRDGTLWLNLGDTYCASGKWGGQLYQTIGGPKHYRGYPWKRPAAHDLSGHGLKFKDLVGIPWLVAFALRADGWYLRSDIIWDKPNPMPESVRDRPTKSHEYLFLLTKSERYYYDADAVKEAWIPRDNDIRRALDGGCRYSGKNRNGYDRACERGDHLNRNATGQPIGNPSAGRNRRTVWRISTQPFPKAHFATFPPKLIEPCILAGTSERGCCPQCGAPWRRVMKIGRGTDGRRHVGLRHRSGYTVSRLDHRGKAPSGLLVSAHTLGWQPTCSCGRKNTVPGIVLDPFMGAGTTAVIALQDGRHFLGCELNPEYIRIAEARLAEARQQARLARGSVT
jgi:DNA modification methylase